MTWLRRYDVILVVAACLLVGVMYCTNSDWSGDPTSPRGDGKYRPVLARGDGHLYYLMARSTVLDGDWVFDNDLARFGDPFFQKTTEAGRKAIPHPIGPTLVWAAPLAAAQGAAWLLDELGADIPLHGYTGFHQRIVFATSVLFAWITVFLAWRAALRAGAGRLSAAFAAVAILLGTSLVYYATYMPSYPHVMDACGVALFLHYWTTTIGRRDLRRFAVLGGLLGLASLVRSQELALGIVVAIELGVAVVDAVRARAGARAVLRLGGLGALALAIALLCFAVQLYEWRVVYGEWVLLPQGARFTRYGHPLVLETLFSSKNGWIATTPLVAAGMVGLAVLVRRQRMVGAGLLAVVVVQVYLCSTIFDWWAGASLSQRRLTSMAYPLVVGLAALMTACARRLPPRVPRAAKIAVASVVLGWFVWWNMAQVLVLTAGKPAGGGPKPMCCEGVPAPLKWLAEPVYKRIGNPFALPASAYYALRFDVGIHRWDLTVGDYTLVPALDHLTDGTYVTRTHDIWDLGGPDAARWAVDGYGPSQQITGAAPVMRFRRSTAPQARALVPLIEPDGVHARWWLEPNAPGDHIEVRWNGEVVIARELAAGWNSVDFDVPEDLVRVGTNTLDIDAPVGLAIGRVELGFR